MKAVIDGFYGQNNLGDDLILTGLLYILSKYGVQEVTIVLCGPDREIMDKIRKCTTMKINFLPPSGMVKRLLRIFPIIPRHEFIVIGGGGLFPKDSWKGHLARLLPLMVGKIIKKRTLLLGVTIDPIHSWCTKLVWRIALQLIDKVIVRDIGSYKNLAAIAAPKRIFIGRDLAFFSPYVNNTEKQPRLLCDDPFVILAPANLWYVGSGGARQEKYAKFIKVWIDLIRLFNQLNFKVVLIPFYQPFDFALCGEIQRGAQSDCILFSPDSYSAEEWVGLFANAHFVVGMRYHSIILSLIYGTPFCAVVYDYKTKWLLEELGLEWMIGGEWGLGNAEHLCRDIDLDVSRLTTKVRELLGSRQEIKIQLNEVKRKITLDMSVYEDELAKIMLRRSRSNGRG